MLAQRYEALGGPVRYHGKPYPSVYQACFAQLAPVPTDRIAAVGDSLRTDVAGAAGVGIEAVLITGGIHAEALGIRWGETAEPAALARLCQSAARPPVAALPAFVW
jgi:ribonucleotide monophosphatase NagD (HAD superfamily)